MPFALLLSHSYRMAPKQPITYLLLLTPSPAPQTEQEHGKEEKLNGKSVSGSSRWISWDLGNRCIWELPVFYRGPVSAGGGIGSIQSPQGSKNVLFLPAPSVIQQTKPG